MESMHEYMQVYKEQLKKGSIQKAYRGLMDYFGNLRSFFIKTHPELHVSGIYYGYMDMTYFALITESLKDRNLKIAIVFVHEAFQFEVWLSGGNRDIQVNFWDLIKSKSWDKYSTASDPRREDHIIRNTLVADLDFSDPERLTGLIEKGSMDFLRDVEVFLSQSE